MKLQTKTSLMLILIVVFALGVSGLVMHFRLEQALRTSVYTSIDTVAQNSAVTIGDYLTTSNRDAKAIGAGIPVKSLLAGELGEVEAYLEQMNGIFRQFKNGLFILGADGDLLVDWPPHPEKRGRNFAYRPYFKRTRASQRGIIGTPYRSARTGAAVLTFTAALFDPQGHFAGLVGCSSQLLDENGLGALRQRAVGETGYIYVFDKSRKMILHPKEERILAKDVPKGANRLFDAALEGFEGVGETINSKGVPMLLALRRVPGTGWIVGAQQPAAEAFSGIHASEGEIALVTFCCAVLGAAIGGLFIGRVLRPLHRLEEITDRLDLPRAGENAEEFLQGQGLSDLKPLQKDSELGHLAGLIRKLYLRLGEALISSRQTEEDLRISQEDLTQALDSSWEMTEKLAEQKESLELNNQQLEQAHQELKTTQSHLLQREKMASIGQLAAGVAHEINNPMGFITSNLTSLGKYFARIQSYEKGLVGLLGESNGQQLKELERLQRKEKIGLIFEDLPDLISESLDGAERVKEIVQNLKTFSRLDEASCKEADLNECLESTLKIVSNELKYKAQIEKMYGSLPLLSCYPQQLNQVFVNLLVNAAQAIPDQGVIKIRSRCEDDDIRISISDDGCGIPEEIRAKIFEPFFTTKGVGKGTGLGMSIAYEIVQKHGGRIDLQSEIGVGTTFTIILPLTGVVEETPQQAVGD